MNSKQRRAIKYAAKESAQAIGVGVFSAVLMFLLFQTNICAVG